MQPLIFLIAALPWAPLASAVCCSDPNPEAPTLISSPFPPRCAASPDLNCCKQVCFSRCRPSKLQSVSATPNAIDQLSQHHGEMFHHHSLISVRLFSGAASQEMLSMALVGLSPSFAHHEWRHATSLTIAAPAAPRPESRIPDIAILRLSKHSHRR
jgi:hypothetical protein